jgi:hypothetical protein
LQRLFSRKSVEGFVVIVIIIIGVVIVSVVVVGGGGVCYDCESVE